ncbi:hypothetical protein [Cellulomonas taurus]|uniref:hypothetical protein n=1 Tax=Cellulomonas taurus TaxID=2729175 RepID=UPI00145E2404|nr:hypothetical protein [Cellulomonas taurus]
MSWLVAGRHPAAEPCPCGGRREVETVEPLIDVADGVDAPYGLPFWLTTPCAGHQLWVANRSHLDYLRDFLGTPNRPNGARPADRQLGHRLPGWLLSAKNRPGVLHGLEVLARRLDTLAV